MTTLLPKPLRDNEGLARRPLVEHLEDLRKAIGWSILFYVIALLISMPLVPRILNLLQYPLLWAGSRYIEKLKFFKVTDGFSVFVYISGWAGLIIASPFILAAVLWFVFPAFRKNERKVFISIILTGIFFFITGIFWGYRWALPLGLKWLMLLNEWLGIEAFFQVEHYLKFVTNGMIACGVAFQIPVVVVTLGYIGIITSEQLRKTRRYAVVVIMALAMILTPPDPFTMILLSIPLLLIHEICIAIIATFERKR